MLNDHCWNGHTEGFTGRALDVCRPRKEALGYGNSALVKVQGGSWLALEGHDGEIKHQVNLSWHLEFG